MLEGELLFTSAAVLELLTQIDELQGYKIKLTDVPGHSIQLSIGDSTYAISSQQASDVLTNESVVSDVSQITEQAYQQLESNSDLELELEPVTSGILKQVMKTLLIGGLVRLTSRIIHK